jgi:triosephosphate isomerase
MGGQDCHFEKHGAFTGDISAPMLVEAGCKYAILGHSERRQYHQELDALIQKKINAAHNAGLIAILCIGETLQQREQNETMKILSSQLAQALPKTATAQNTIVAYEPVWAIGTGKNAQSADIAAAHGHIRNELKKNLGDRGGDISILYGGSVKGANAEEILRTDDVDGALVGGASLIVDDFWKIYQSLPRK